MSNSGHFDELLEQGQLSPQIFVNLISILDAYLIESAVSDKPYLMKDGVKIIL